MTDDVAGPDGSALSEGLGSTVPKRAKVCPLQECRGRPRCGQCRMLDAMYPPQRTLSGLTKGRTRMREDVTRLQAEVEQLRAENAALKREAHAWWTAARDATVAERERCAQRVVLHSQYPIQTDYDRGYDKARKDAAETLRNMSTYVGTYTPDSQPKRTPLTEFERMRIIGDEFPIALVQQAVIAKVDAVCRAIERAHGIGA